MTKMERKDFADLIMYLVEGRERGAALAARYEHSDTERAAWFHGAGYACRHAIDEYVKPWMCAEVEKEYYGDEAPWIENGEA